ncbi:urg3 [Hyphodiscus hymeniophilus]|uniref:Urg3 n=1 Tax=Hyphodiscus hymeniophilus TaxID=353542 RepID=A0A9P6VD34_9HELO|nr:urg3 [Hyphodiscus hymeniophilus]
MDSEAHYQYLLSLKSVRESAQVAYKAAQADQLRAFDFHPEKLDDVVDFVCSVITRDHSPETFSQIPPHGRWQHFETQGVPRLEGLLNDWKCAGVQNLECTRRLVDLFLVSVLLDAGAGDVWKYTEEGTGLQIERSEGLAVASLYAFTTGVFSGTDFQVDALGLKVLTAERLGESMQSSAENPLVGLEGRAELLQGLGDSLLSLPEIFGQTGRPGNMVDYLLLSMNESKALSLELLWDLLQQLLIPTWPRSRTLYENKPIGDAWPLHVFSGGASSSGIVIQPFHKLTQWLTYSLLVVFERLLDVKWTGTEYLTGLPEYRNGGLYVDTGVLTLKPEVLNRGLAGSDTNLPKFDASDEAIVEWRSLTVALLDETLQLVNQKLAAKTKGAAVPLTLAQLLEAGTWKAGRELAAKYRPQTKCSPILIQSDGTLF